MKALVAILLLSFMGLPLVAEESTQARAGDDGQNVLFSLTLVDTDASGHTVERRVQTIAVEDRAARMESGWKVPIPVTSSVAGGSLDSPVTAYKYQDIGLAVSLNGRRLGNERIRITGRLEITAIDAEHTLPSSHSPQVGTFSHHFEANVTNGTPTTLVEAPKPDGGSFALVLTATVEGR